MLRIINIGVVLGRLVPLERHSNCNPRHSRFEFKAWKIRVVFQGQLMNECFCKIHILRENSQRSL